jgi:hypothetical protein
MPSRTQPPKTAHIGGGGDITSLQADGLADYLAKVKSYPPGAIALPCAELSRFSAFTMAIVSLEYPPGTRIHMVNSLSIAANLNIVIRDLPPEAEWLAFQSDDHVFSPDSLLRMLARMYENDLDVLVPIMCRRHPPFSALIFKEETEEGFMAYAWDEIPTEGLLGPLWAAGTGGMLIRRSALNRLAEAGLAPGGMFFENSAGEIINEDTEFCAKLRAVGVDIYADCSVTMGHCGMFIAWPSVTPEGKWGIHFQMGEGPEGALKGIFLEAGEKPPG